MPAQEVFKELRLQFFPDCLLLLLLPLLLLLLLMFMWSLRRGWWWGRWGKPSFMPIKPRTSSSSLRISVPELRSYPPNIRLRFKLSSLRSSVRRFALLRGNTVGLLSPWSSLFRDHRHHVRHDVKQTKKGQVRNVRGNRLDRQEDCDWIQRQPEKNQGSRNEMCEH